MTLTDKDILRVAIIDIGTQTSKINIAEVENDNFQTIYKLKVATQLGRGGILNNEISPEAEDRLFRAMDRFKDICLEKRCTKVMAFATSMMRRSINGQALVEKVFERTGIAIQIIDGEEEADLIFKGVSNCIGSNIEQYLIIDIGGGSTEFILVSDGQASWKHSFSFGAISLLERFEVSDPIEQIEIERIEEFLKIELTPLFENCVGVQIPLVGSSGSFDSISEMIHHRTGDIKNYNGTESQTLSNENLISLYNSIISSSKAERLRMRGLVEFRVDSIVTALVVIRFVIDRLNLSSTVRAPYSLKEGALIKYFLPQQHA